MRESTDRMESHRVEVYNPSIGTWDMVAHEATKIEAEALVCGYQGLDRLFEPRKYRIVSVIIEEVN